MHQCSENAETTESHEMVSLEKYPLLCSQPGKILGNLPTFLDVGYGIVLISWTPLLSRTGGRAVY